jgi:hypothetical protein
MSFNVFPVVMPASSLRNNIHPAVICRRPERCRGIVAKCDFGLARWCPNRGTSRSRPPVYPGILRLNRDCRCRRAGRIRARSWSGIRRRDARVSESRWTYAPLPVRTAWLTAEGETPAVCGLVSCVLPQRRGRRQVLRSFLSIVITFHKPLFFIHTTQKKGRAHFELGNTHERRQNRATRKCGAKTQTGK